MLFVNIRVQELTESQHTMIWNGVHPAVHRGVKFHDNLLVQIERPFGDVSLGFPDGILQRIHKMHFVMMLIIDN